MVQLGVVAVFLPGEIHTEKPHTMSIRFCLMLGFSLYLPLLKKIDHLFWTSNIKWWIIHCTLFHSDLNLIWCRPIGPFCKFSAGHLVFLSGLRVDVWSNTHFFSSNIWCLWWVHMFTFMHTTISKIHYVYINCEYLELW